MGYIDVVAVLISGICLGWLEKMGQGGQTGQILKAILAVITSTAVLGETITFTSYDHQIGFWNNVLESDKSPLPLMWLLVGIVAGVYIGGIKLFRK